MQFRWNFQLLIHHSLFRNLPCSTANLLTVEVDRIFVTLNTSGFTGTVAFNVSNDFWQDRALHSWSSSQSFIVYGKMLLLIEPFISNRKLWVVSKHKSSSKYAINSGIHQNSVLVTLFFPTSIASLMMFCVRLLPDLMICKFIHCNQYNFPLLFQFFI